MSIETLRAKALAHNESLRWRYPVCLDLELRAKIDQAATALQQLHAERAELEADGIPARKLSDNPRLKIDKQIAEAEARLEALEASIPDDSLLQVVFRRLAPGDYQTLQTEHIIDAKQLNLATFWPALAAAAFVCCEDRHGTGVGLTWDEVREATLSSMDLDYIYQGLVGFNRALQTIPFETPTSGVPATN